MTANQVQIRRDSATNLDAATPALAELGYDTTNKRLRVGDGSTSGGISHAKALDTLAQTFYSGTAGGTANALTLTISSYAGFAAYAAFQRFSFKAASTNTGSATIDVNSEGAVTFKKRTLSGLSDLDAGDVQQDGIYRCVYDGTYMQLDNPSTQGSTGTAPKLLQTYSVTNGTALNITGNIDSTYRTYEIKLIVSVLTDNAELNLRTSSDGGSSYDAGGSDYDWGHRSTSTAGTDGSANDSSDATIELAANLGNASTETGNLTIELWNPSNSSAHTCLSWRGNIKNGSGQSVNVTGAGSRLAAAAVNAVRILASSGNVTATAELWGIP